MNSMVEYDVVVVGAGSAGVAAACTAAECGARTALVERSGHIGGTLVGQLLEHSAGFHDVLGNQAIAGFGQRLIDLLAHYGGTPGHIRDDVGYTATRTPVNHAELAMAEAALLGDAGVDVWLNSPVAEVDQRGGRIEEIGVLTTGGPRRLRPAVVVDCSGDGVVATLAGAASHPDAAGRQQPASLLFKVAGINFAELLGYAASHPADLRVGSIVGTATAEHVNLWGFGSLLAKGHAGGLLSLLRKEMHVAGWPRRGEAVVNVTRVPLPDLDATSAGQASVQLSRQILEFSRWFRAMVPGCADSYIAAVGDRLGIRESRRIVGEYTLTRDDVLSGARFDDTVARAAFPIDIHAADLPTLSHTEQPRGAYEIPYRSLVPTGTTNVLVAGRCLSTTQEANGSVRITATCFATGEAAGAAAAVAARSGAAVREIPYRQLRQALIERGVLLGTSSAVMA
jgi:2-polyprenyl-6-methoxyphenol hydroxylase-like FAD-dependent oxidoreductase